MEPIEPLDPNAHLCAGCSRRRAVAQAVGAVIARLRCPRAIVRASRAALAG
jgi:hypothetical protein